MSINLFNSYIRLGKPTMTNRQLQETSFFFVSKSAVFPCNYLSLFKREDLPQEVRIGCVISRHIVQTC